MFTHCSRSLTRVANGLLFVLLLAGCTGAPVAQIDPTLPPAATTVPTTESAPTTAATVKPAPGATAAATDSPAANATPATSAAPDEAAVKDGIQQALDLYAQAYNENKPELLKQAADQTNAPFRRFIQTRFDNADQIGGTGHGGYEFTVESVKSRDQGFWQAHVLNAAGSVTDWTFRQLDGRWVMSEPTDKQIGAKQKVETEHFIFVTYPWSNDVNQKLMTIMEKARQNVLDRLGKVPDEKPQVTIKPIFGVGKAENPSTLAYYDRNSRNIDQITIFAPESYVFQSYDQQTGWEPELETTLTHEYTHLVNNRSFTPIARMSGWMYEGIAVYISQDNSYDDLVRQAVDTDTIIPIMDTSGKVQKEDLEHFTILPTHNQIVTGYGLSKTLVMYITETYGGLDGFWKFVDAYDKSQRLPDAIQQTFGVSYEQFDKDWRAWLKEKY